MQCTCCCCVRDAHHQLFMHNVWHWLLHHTHCTCNTIPCIHIWCVACPHYVFAYVVHAQYMHTPMPWSVAVTCSCCKAFAMCGMHVGEHMCCLTVCMHTSCGCTQPHHTFRCMTPHLNVLCYDVLWMVMHHYICVMQQYIAFVFKHHVQQCATFMCMYHAWLEPSCEWTHHVLTYSVCCMLVCGTVYEYWYTDLYVCGCGDYARDSVVVDVVGVDCVGCDCGVLLYVWYDGDVVLCMCDWLLCGMQYIVWCGCCTHTCVWLLCVWCPHIVCAWLACTWWCIYAGQVVDGVCWWMCWCVYVVGELVWWHCMTVKYIHTCAQHVYTAWYVHTTQHHYPNTQCISCILPTTHTHTTTTSCTYSH